MRRRMNLSLKFIILLSILLLQGCDNPLPPSKMSFEGVWRSENMAIMITRQGQVSYKKQDGNVSTSINGPIKQFTKDGFTVGFAFLTSEFVVNKKPLEVEGQWKMTIDGVELIRD